MFRSTESVQAENLFLRRQLALLPSVCTLRRAIYRMTRQGCTANFINRNR